MIFSYSKLQYGLHEFGGVRALTILFFHFSLALGGFRRPRCVSLSTESNRVAGLIFNVAFGQNGSGALHK